MKKQLQWLVFYLIISLVFFNNTWAGEEFQLRILYLNDFHGFAEAHQPLGKEGLAGGIASLAGEVNRLRQGQPTLLLAAGDMIQGNPWANLFQGESTIAIMNAMGFTAMTLGNHEFDFGQEVLQKRISQAQFPILTANLSPFPGLKPYLIKNMAGFKIAIIGLVTEDTPVATHPKNVEGLHFTPAAETTRKILQELGETPDLILVLSHLGLPADRRLAQMVKGIQVIVGGHTHTRIEKPLLVNETLIVQAWEHAKVLGVLDLTLKDRALTRAQGKLIPISPDPGKDDPQVAALVDHYRNQASRVLDEVIGRAEVDLQGKGSRRRETNLGNFLADILRKEGQADVALINGGGIRADISQGPIRMKDLYSVLPFRNHLVVINLTGKELQEVLEYGLSDLSGEGGQFPQLSGIRVTYDPAEPVGRRVKAVWIREQPLVPDTRYQLATLDFLLAGGDGYSVFTKMVREDSAYPDSQRVDLKRGRVVLFDSGRDLRDIVIQSIRGQEKIAPALEGRHQPLK